MGLHVGVLVALSLRLLVRTRMRSTQNVTLAGGRVAAGWGGCLRQRTRLKVPSEFDSRGQRKVSFCLISLSKGRCWGKAGFWRALGELRGGPRVGGDRGGERSQGSGEVAQLMDPKELPVEPRKGSGSWFLEETSPAVL